MNTKKLFFGFLAIAVLTVVSISTTITIDKSQKLGIEKGKVTMGTDR